MRVITSRTSLNYRMLELQMKDAQNRKIITKSCPTCQHRVPIACKGCPCGHMFPNKKITAKLVLTFPDKEDFIRRCHREKRKRPDYFDAKEQDGLMKQAKPSASETEEGVKERLRKRGKEERADDEKAKQDNGKENDDRHGNKEEEQEGNDGSDGEGSGSSSGAGGGGGGGSSDDGDGAAAGGGAAATGGGTAAGGSAAAGGDAAGGDDGGKEIGEDGDGNKGNNDVGQADEGEKGDGKEDAVRYYGDFNLSPLKQQLYRIVLRSINVKLSTRSWTPDVFK